MPPARLRLVPRLVAFDAKCLVRQERRTGWFSPGRRDFQSLELREINATAENVPLSSMAVVDFASVWTPRSDMTLLRWPL